MASIQSSKGSKYTQRGVFEDEPIDHVESAGELLIKQLVQKQTNTQITLEQLLKEEKKFERGVGFVSLKELGAGARTLQQFEERKQKAEKLDKLLSRGFKRQEALLEPSDLQKSKATPEAQQFLYQHLIQQPRQPPEYPPQKQSQLGRRQEYELALSVKPHSLETQLYKFAISNESARKHPQSDNLPPGHPIHQLAEMERTLISTADPVITARTIRRKRRQQLQAIADPQVHSNKPPDRHKSLWDITETPVFKNKPSHNIERKIMCYRESFYTIREGKIMKVEHNTKEQNSEPTLPKSKPNGNAFVCLQSKYDWSDISGKLSEEQIKEIPMFRNYNPGKESKTLYIKNLSNHVTESDLGAIFNQFQAACDGNIIFRLMSGKMRGQAFVTFKCCKNATEALKTMNGTILKGKPIIIQYGRQQD